MRYLQLTHNEWDPATKTSRPKVLHSFGREDQLDRDAIKRLVASLTRLLDPATALTGTGPAFCAASAVSTKIPVPMIAPTPSMVSWKAPSERWSDFFSAVARMASSGFTRPNIGVLPTSGAGIGAEASAKSLIGKGGPCALPQLCGRR